MINNKSNNNKIIEYSRIKNGNGRVKYSVYFKNNACTYHIMLLGWIRFGARDLSEIIKVR